jgi:hypothetical protein
MKWMKQPVKKPAISKYWLIAILFMIVQICLHFIASGDYELHRDEMLYFNMGDHLSFGYLTVPPVTGFLAFVAKSLFGYSVFGIRIIPALLGTATLFIIAKTVKDLGGGIPALIISSVAFLFIPGNLLIFSLFTPNAVEIFLWSLFIYLIFRLSKTQNYRIWIWIGIVAGLGFNTKYSIAFPIAGFFTAIIIYRKFKLLFNLWFFAGLAIGLLLIIPNITWQYNHNWPVIFHMHELEKTQLSNLSFFNFFADLFSLNSTLIIIWLIGLTALIFSKEKKEIRFIGAAIAIVFLLFIVMKGKAYYTMGLLPFLIAFGGFILERYFKPRYLYVPIMAAITVFSLFSLPYVLPVLSFKSLEKYAEKTGSWVSAPFIRWEDGKEHQVSQVYADMTGWKELANTVEKAYNSLTREEKNHCTIFCQRNYGYAGAIHFYGHQHKLPEPVTFHESYVFWAPDVISDGPLIYVFYNSDEMKPLFSEINEIGTIQNPYFREKGLKVFLCKSPTADIKKIYTELALKEKSKFLRSN